jgi:hypothetical protein
LVCTGEEGVHTDSTDAPCPRAVNFVLLDIVSVMLAPTSTEQKDIESAAGHVSDAETTGATPFRRECNWSGFEIDEFMAVSSRTVAATIDECISLSIFSDRAKQYPAHLTKERS